MTDTVDASCRSADRTLGFELCGSSGLSCVFVAADGLDFLRKLVARKDTVDD